MTIELDRTALETEYRALMGLRNWEKVDRRWSAKRLTKEIADVKARQAEAAARKAADEAASAARKAEFEARAAARGTFEEFAGKAYGTEMDASEKKLAYMARRVKDAIAPGAFEEKVAKFAEELVKFPDHTMQWSMSMFSAAADVVVARHVKHAVESGSTYEMFVEDVQRRVLQAAANPGRSTSPTSNLTEQEITSKFASLIRDYNY